MSNQRNGLQEGITQEERTTLTKLVAEVQTIKDQMATVADILKQLSEKTAALSDQAARSEIQFAQTQPYFSAMKIHVDSFPNALREARRSDLATQKMLEAFEMRMREIEIGLASADRIRTNV